MWQLRHPPARQLAVNSKTSLGLAIAIAAIALASALFVAAGYAADLPSREGVLIIHSNARPTPAAVIVEDAMRQVLANSLGRPVEIYSEYLDAERFPTPGNAATAGEYLARKYGDRNIRVIVASAAQALQFAIAFRDRISASVPVVHVGVPKDQLEAMTLLPTVVGATVDLDPTATLRMASRLQPDAKHLVIALGAAERDRAWGDRVRSAVKRLPADIDAEYLAGLRTEELLQRLRALPKNTIVFTPGYFVDGAGQVGSPRQSVELIAAASTAPVYGALDTFMGAGVVGGYMTPYVEQATRAGGIVVKLLNGTPPSEIAPSSVDARPMVDWRQIQRWGIDDRLLPPDTIVQFREPSLWARYWQAVSIALAILVLQAGSIVWLLAERRRRRLAEADSQKRFSEMAHMNRRVAMGGLTASIAHELNQPLGAIHNNAGAAQLLIKADPPRLDEVAEILEDIKHDDKRASEVLARIRRMLRKTDLEVGALDLSDAMGETQKLLAYDAQTHGVSVKVEPEAGLPKVWADSVQVQQVLLNLSLNSIEAMQGQPPETRQLTIRSRQSNAKEAEVSVIDSGTGIPDEILPNVFDPFVTSKVGGMGLGLSISRTIVEAYGGRMRAESMPTGGAAVHFTLPFESGRHP